MQNLESRGISIIPADFKRSPARFQIKDLTETVGKNCCAFEQLIMRHHYRFLWTYAINGILGLWLLSSPFLFDYRSSSLLLSDTISGACIAIFELLSFSPLRARLRWGTAAVAFWLLIAPFVFWSPTPAVYLNDTLIACFVITFSILVPGVPGCGGIDLPGPDQPLNWTYNPSSWIRRWLGIALALFGFFISRYLAAYQLGYIPHAWDPFFGSGSEKILTSVVSRSFPVSDAGLGSVAYLMEVLSGFTGNRARWRTAPWTVVLFALVVLPLGVTSVGLVITQPIIVGSWCGLCLVAAVALLTSVPLAVHEVVAVGQFLVEAKMQKKNVWQVFWMGGSIVGAHVQDPDRMHYSFTQRWLASVQGVTVPWTILAQLAIGLWLMARTELLPFGGRTNVATNLPQMRCYLIR